jgi:RHS repeat-associated protein
MQSAQLQTLSESPLAAKPQLSEKPRLGFETKKTAGKPGPSVCNFIVTLGLRATVIENGVRKTYRARYYNPVTGRFMSRDPLDGKAKDPKTLHKYLYANGDPINRIDPRGRSGSGEAVAGGDLGEYGGIILAVATHTVVGATVLACAVNVSYAMDALNVAGYTDIMPWGFCSARGKRWTCDASGHYVDYRIGNATLSPIFTGSGSDQTQACQNAISALQGSSPPGSYVRHPQCFNCMKR